jgi:hypothetical protein
MLEDILVFPYNDKSHWSLFILKHHGTSHFDFISRYHSTFKANQFVKCVAFGWFYAKGIPHNSNKWVIIGIRLIVDVPLPPQNGAWECGYLIVKYFSQCLDKCGDREHCLGVEVNLETCYHHIFTIISKLL